jgi:prepilin-type N-terminal cleavage/methylation domain-containing protein
MKRPNGFTLIELVIVVALILIIAAIAIPSFTEAKIHADETSAVQSIRVINQAEIQYEAAYGGFADSLANLGGRNRAQNRPLRHAFSTRAWPGAKSQGIAFPLLAAVLQMSPIAHTSWALRRSISTAPGSGFSAPPTRM